MHYLTVRKHIHSRSRQLVRPFVSIPENLFLILKLSHSAISGSSALRFMLPATSHEWQCKDLDIYSPASRDDIVISFFMLEGYNISTQAKSDQPYQDGSFTVTTMTKGHLSVDIIRMAHPSFFTVISRFHLSCLMNFISADGFFSAYPTLTDSEFSLVSRLAFVQDGAPKNSTVESYRKYHRRGFKLLHLPRSVDLPTSDDLALPHICGRSSWCPHTPRTTSDPYCLYVPFQEFPRSINMEQQPARGFYDDGHGVVWVLGGNDCNGTRNVIWPFTSTSGVIT